MTMIDMQNYLKFTFFFNSLRELGFSWQCSRNSPGDSAQGTIWSAGEETLVGYVQDKYLPAILSSLVFTLSTTVDFPFLANIARKTF